MAAHEWTVNLPDGTEYVIESERDLTPDELNAEVSNIRSQHADTGQSTTASAFNAAGRGFVGGAGSLVEGIGDVGALIPGLENNTFQESGQSVKDFGAESFPVNPANEGKFAVKAGEVIGGVAEQALEFASGAKVLGAIGQVGRAGALATASMFGKGADSGQDMAVQYGVNDDPWKMAAFTLGGGVIEAGTEKLGGFAAESALARRFGIGGIEGAPVTGFKGYAGATGMEGGEEMAANTLNNTLTNILVSPEEAAAAGQRRPGYLEGNLEAGALGAIGGGVMSLPLLGATPAAPLPPPAGFTNPLAPPPANAPAQNLKPTGRASAVGVPAPSGPTPLTDDELAGLESPPSDNLSQIISSPSIPIPPERINIVAGAIATSSTPAVEAGVIETARIAAALHAQKTSQIVEAPALPPAALPLPVPVVQSQPPASEADPVASGLVEPAVRNLILADGRRLPFQYELAEDADLRLAPNNDRDYTSPKEKARIEAIIQNFAPEIVVNDNPTPDTGPAIVDATGEVQGGNRRTLVLRDERTAAAYRNYLKINADRYGITPAQIDGMKAPRLIRRLQGAPGDFNRALNDSAVGDIGVLDNAISSARVLTDEVRSAAADIFENAPDATPLSVLTNGNTKALATALKNAGVIRPNQRGAYIAENGNLTPEGARSVRYILMAEVLPDRALLQAIGDTPMEGKVMAVLPALSRMRRRGVDISEFAAMISQEVTRQSTKGVKGKVVSVEDFQNQGELGLADALPESVRRLQSIFGNASGLTAKRIFNQLASTLAPYEKGELGLFGESNRASLADLTNDEVKDLGGNSVDAQAPAPNTDILNETDSADPFTGQPSSITGRIFDEGRRQDVARRNRERMGQAARLGDELLRGESDTNDVRRSVGSSGLAQISLASLGLERQGDHLVSTNSKLRPLPVGSEATPFADDAAGVVYKLFPLAAVNANGVKLAPKNGPEGWVVDSAPATTLEVLEKIALLHEMGAIPSEIVGITDSGAILVKQPLFTELSAEQKGNLLPLRARAVAAVGGIQLANGMFPDIRVIYQDGKPYFMGDLHPGNIMLDAAGNPTIIDALISPVPERMQYDVPDVTRAVQEAASKQNTDDQTDDLFREDTPDFFAGTDQEPFKLAPETAAERQKRKARELKAEQAKIARQKESDRKRMEAANLALPFDQVAPVKKLDPDEVSAYTQSRGAPANHPDQRTFAATVQRAGTDPAYDQPYLLLPDGGRGAESGPGDNAVRPGRGLTPEERQAEETGRFNLLQNLTKADFGSGKRITSVMADLVDGTIPAWNITGQYIRTPEDFVNLVMPIRSPLFESLKMAVVDGDGKVIHSQILTVGSLTETIASPRDFLRVLEAAKLMGNPAGIIMSHNHPSGDPTPSQSDITMTRQIREALPKGVELLDHLITNGEKFYSFNAMREIDMAQPHVAPWQSGIRGKRVDDENTFGTLVRLLRQDATDHGHIILIDTRGRLIAVERTNEKDPRELAAAARTFAVQHGGFGVMLDLGHLSGASALSATRIARDVLTPVRINFFDSSSVDMPSFRAAGILTEPDVLGMPEPETGGVMREGGPTPPTPTDEKAAKPPTVFEGFFGTEKEVEVKEREAQSAIRAALEVPLFKGILDDHQPGKPLEDTIAGLSEEQRNALHHRIIEDVSNLSGTNEEASAYAGGLSAYIATVPELAASLTVSVPELQYTNLVTAASILSGNYGQTGAFSFLMSLGNDQIKFANPTNINTRGDAGRKLASQSGIGSRMATLSGAVVKQHTVAMKRMGFTDADLAKMAAAFNDRIFTANEMEEIFAGATTSPEGFRVATALQKLQKYTDAAAAKAKPQESEIETLWRLMQEARGTKRGAAIAAALKAFMPDGPRDLTRANQAVLADFRKRMQTQGGESLAKSFWQLMSNTPRPAPGSLASFDSATQSMLGDLLRRAVEKAGLSGETTSIQPDAIDKLVLNLSRDNLRWDKIASADESVRAEIDAIEDESQREAFRAAWEDATSNMSFAIGGPALMRRALRDQMKDSPPNWKAAFDTGKPMLEAVAMDRVTFVNAAMVKIDNALTSEEARSNIPALRKEMEATFNDIAAERYAGWLQGRERIADQEKTAKARKAFMAALQNRGVAEARLAKLAEALSDTPSNDKPSAVNPITALINAQMKKAAPDFVERMAELGVTADVAGPLSSMIEENRRRAANIDAVTGKPAKLAESILTTKIGPLVAKLPIGSIVTAFMAAPAHLRNNGAWRNLQITNWLTNNGIDAALASRLAVSMDEMTASVMANIIYQQQEKFIIRQKGVGNQADLAKFTAKFRENADAILKAIEMGLLTDGTPWQSWFASVTGIPAMTTKDLSQVAAWENILTNDSYFNSEKGVAAAKLREFLDAKFGKDATFFEILAASYDAAALSGGSTFFIQYSAPIGRFIGTVAQDLMASLAKPSSAGDIADSVMAALDAYTTELPLAFKYDSGGNFQGDSAVKVGQVAVLKRDLIQQQAIWQNKKLPMGKRLAAAARWARSSQDFLRQAMNAADSASVKAFTRYFETREVARIMRSNNLSKKEVGDIMDGMGNTADNAAAEAEARGYTGSLRRSYVNDAMWARWKNVVAAHNSTPEEHRLEMENLLEDATDEAEFQTFVGDKRDTGGMLGLPDFLLGQIQEIGENRFRNARRLVQDGKATEGSLRRIFWRSVLGFVGVPLNAARAAFWYSPLGILNWINWKANGSSFDPKTNPYARSLGSALQVRQRQKELITGNAMLLIGLALLKGMLDDEDEWKLNGNGPDPSKHPDEAKAWARLHTKFSIEHTAEDGSQEVIPFQRGMLEYLKTPLMMLAGATDAQMNAGLRGEKEASLTDITWGVMQRVGLSSITTGMRNVAGAQGALQRGASDDRIGSQAAFTASPIIPYSGMLRWAATWDHPEQLEQGFKNGLPMAVYWNDARPALNSFGQTLKPTPSMGELTSNQTNGLLPGYFRQQNEDDRKLYGWIEKTGIQPTVYSRGVLEKRIVKTLTDAEWYDYTKASGKVRYDQTMAAIDGTLELPRTIAIPRAPDIKVKSRMKQGLANIDPANKDAMREAGEILQDIGQAAHAAGLAAIKMDEPMKAKAVKKKAAIY